LVGVVPGQDSGLRVEGLESGGRHADRCSALGGGERAAVLTREGEGEEEEGGREGGRGKEGGREGMGLGCKGLGR